MSCEANCEEMEEDSQKRKTDCLYFFASPLSCKKGTDCEYRHSEIAQLNPRDCWYWLEGNCFNTTCGFRHPPLDGLAETPFGSMHCSIPVNKTSSVPCYFFFRGFCSKGDKCSFLHGNDGTVLAWKSEKIVPASINALPLKDTVAEKYENGPPPIIKHLDSPPSKNLIAAKSENKPVPKEEPRKKPKTARKETVDIRVKEDLHQTETKSIQQRKCNSSPKCEEASASESESESLPHVKGSCYSESDFSLDQGSEEPMVNHIEPEESLEAIPRFDVLVNNGYEDDSEFLEHQNMKRNCVVYDFNDPCEYNNSMSHYHSMEEMFYPSSSRKRKLVRVEQGMIGQRRRDLRDHLKKRRLTNNSNCPIKVSGRIQERNLTLSLNQRLHGRLNSIESIRVNATLSNAVTNQHGPLRHLRQSIPREHSKKNVSRLKFIFSRSSRKLDFSLDQKRSVEKSPRTFMGPKTLDQIKEDKRRTDKDVELLGRPKRFVSADFEGPKPLSEILNEKKVENGI